MSYADVQDAVVDTVVKYFPTLAGVALLGIFAILVLAMRNTLRERRGQVPVQIYLTEWVCTDEKVSIVYVNQNNILVPVTTSECVEYRRKP
jgi:hypothetical protein